MFFPSNEGKMAKTCHFVPDKMFKHCFKNSLSRHVASLILNKAEKFQSQAESKSTEEAQ